MASTKRHSQEIPSSDNIQKVSDNPLSKTESTPEKQEKATPSQNQGSSQTQSARAGNGPLTREQVLEIKQPTAQFIINSFLQAAAFAVAIAFGVFAVKLVQVGSTGNGYANQAAGQALTANQLTLLTFCFAMNSSQVVDFDPICSRIAEAAESMISSAASALFTNLPATATATATTTTPISASTLPTIGGGSQRSGSNKSAIIAGVVTGTIIISGAVLFFCLRRRRPRPRAKSAPPGSTNPHLTNTTTIVGANYPDSENSTPLLQRKSLRKWFRETFMNTKVVARAE